MYHQFTIKLPRVLTGTCPRNLNWPESAPSATCTYLYDASRPDSWSESLKVLVLGIAMENGMSQRQYAMAVIIIMTIGFSGPGVL